jgi:hypothetical protein
MKDLLASSTLWSAISALATVAASAGIFLAARQLRFAAWVRIQELFTDPGFTEARSTVFKYKKKRYSDTEWTPDEKTAGMLTCRRMDEICRLAPFLGLVPFFGERRFLKVWANSVGWSWVVLEGMVKDEQGRTWPEKWDAFQKLGQKAQKKLVP